MKISIKISIFLPKKMKNNNKKSTGKNPCALIFFNIKVFAQAFFKRLAGCRDSVPARRRQNSVLFGVNFNQLHSALRSAIAFAASSALKTPVPDTHISIPASAHSAIVSPLIPPSASIMISFPMLFA